MAQEIEEPKQIEWSEWSEWMLDSELGAILSNIGDKETQVETYIEYCAPIGDKKATQWGPWESENNSAWFDTRMLARYRWKDR